MLNPRRWGFALVAVAALLLASRPAAAAGFAIFEQGARSMGFAGAFVAQASDPSAIFFNAAGIAFLKGNQIHAGAALIAPNTDFTGQDPFPGSSATATSNVGVTVPPVFDFTHQFSERLVLGIGLDVPFGLRTGWDNPDSFSGRFISKQAKLTGFSLNPTVAYKLADRFAVGVGLDIRFSKVSLERNAGGINPYTQQVFDIAAVDLESHTNTGFGFNLGILAKPNDALSIGVSYRSKVKVDFDGDATFTRIPTGNAQLDALAALALPVGSAPVTTSIDFPAIAMAGVAYSWKDWTVEGDVDWYQWSSFQDLAIVFPNQPSLSQTITENYKDTWQFRIGVERRLNDTWAVRGGYYYDETPSPPESVGPLLPDASRNGAALGGTWKRGRLNVSAAYWHVFFKDRSTEGVNRDNFNGLYQSSANVLALSIGYGF